MIIFHLDCYWKRASILTMLEYYLMTDFLCLAWVGKGGRKGQLIARCRAQGRRNREARQDLWLTIIWQQKQVSPYISRFRIFFRLLVSRWREEYSFFGI